MYVCAYVYTNVYNSCDVHNEMLGSTQTYRHRDRHTNLSNIDSIALVRPPIPFALEHLAKDRVVGFFHTLHTHTHAHAHTHTHTHTITLFASV